MSVLTDGTNFQEGNLGTYKFRGKMMYNWQLMTHINFI